MKNLYLLGITTFLSLYACRKPTEACFTYSPSVINTYTEVTFDATCSQNAGKFSWSFGDGSNTTVTSSTVTHTFPAPGKYLVTLGVQSSDGKSSGTDKLIIQREVTVQ